MVDHLKENDTVLKNILYNRMTGCFTVSGTNLDLFQAIQYPERALQ
jgi:hypothetical protein